METWIIGFILFVAILLLPFFVFRIRQEVIELNRAMRRLLALVEAVVPDEKKPAPAAAPTKTCRNCKTVNKMTAVRCSNCGNKFGLESD